MATDKTRTYATGKRKTAIARVWIKAGSGTVTVNGIPARLSSPSRSDVIAEDGFLPPMSTPATVVPTGTLSLAIRYAPPYTTAANMASPRMSAMTTRPPSLSGPGRSSRRVERATRKW